MRGRVRALKAATRRRSPKQTGLITRIMLPPFTSLFTAKSIKAILILIFSHRI